MLFSVQNKQQSPRKKKNDDKILTLKNSQFNQSEGAVRASGKPLETETEPLAQSQGQGAKPAPLPKEKNRILASVAPVKKGPQAMLENFVYKYFKKPGQTPPLLGSTVNELQHGLNKKNDSAYSKLVRCLLVANSCVKFEKELKKSRLYGTSSNQYKIALRGKTNVKNKLLWVDDTVKPEDILKSAPWIINPLSVKFFSWNIVMGGLIIYAMTYMPYGLIYAEEDPNRELAENLMNILFGADIIVNFFTGVILDDGG